MDWAPEADWYAFTSQVEHFLVQEKENDWYADGYGSAKTAAVYTLDLDTEAAPAAVEKFDTPPAPVETTFHHWKASSLNNPAAIPTTMWTSGWASSSWGSIQTAIRRTSWG